MNYIWNRKNKAKSTDLVTKSSEPTRHVCSIWFSMSNDQRNPCPKQQVTPSHTLKDWIKRMVAMQYKPESHWAWGKVMVPDGVVMQNPTYCDSALGSIKDQVLCKELRGVAQWASAGLACARIHLQYRPLRQTKSKSRLEHAVWSMCRVLVCHTFLQGFVATFLWGWG